MARRVVITGMGIWSCLGKNKEEVSVSLREGKSGIGIDPQRIEYGYRSPLTGIVEKPQLKGKLDRKLRMYLAEEGEYAYMATLEAFEQAKITEEYLLNNEIGVLFGNDSSAKAVIESHEIALEKKDTTLIGSSAIFQSMNSTVTMNLSTIFHLKGINMTISAMFTLSGVPVLYSGDEIAQENDYSYHSDPVKAEDSRWLHRGNMDWKKAQKRKEKDCPEGAVFAEISRLEKLRSKYGVFDDEADVWILNTGCDHILGIGRYYRGEQLLALFNFSKDPQTAWLHDETMYNDLSSGHRCKAGSVKIPSGGFRWLYKKF